MHTTHTQKKCQRDLYTSKETHIYKRDIQKRRIHMKTYHTYSLEHMHTTHIDCVHTTHSHSLLFESECQTYICATLPHILTDRTCAYHIFSLSLTFFHSHTHHSLTHTLFSRTHTSLSNTHIIKSRRVHKKRTLWLLSRRSSQ